MKSLFNWFSRSMEEAPGEPSALRVVVVLSLLAIVAIWTLVSGLHRELAEFPQSVLEFVLLLLGGKLVQKFAENKTPPPAAP